MLLRDEVLTILREQFPCASDIIREQTTDDGTVLFYPVLGDIVNDIVCKSRSSAFSDRSELRKIFDLAERALTEGEEDIQSLFKIEMLENFAGGMYSDVPVRDLMGPASRAFHDNTLLSMARYSKFRPLWDAFFAWYNELPLDSINGERNTDIMDAWKHYLMTHNWGKPMGG